MISTAPCACCRAVCVTATYADERPRCARYGAFVAATEEGRLARLVAMEPRSADYMLGVNQGRAVAREVQGVML